MRPSRGGPGGRRHSVARRAGAGGAGPAHWAYCAGAAAGLTLDCGQPINKTSSGHYRWAHRRGAPVAQRPLGHGPSASGKVSVWSDSGRLLRGSPGPRPSLKLSLPSARPGSVPAAESVSLCLSRNCPPGSRYQRRSEHTANLLQVPSRTSGNTRP